MGGQNRSGLTRVEVYDGDAKRPKVNQLTGEDSTTSQAFYTNQFVLTTAGVAQALPDKSINPGIQAAIKAKVTNGASLYFGSDTFSANTASSSNFSLVPGESTALNVDNLNRIYMFSGTTSDGIEITLV